MPRQTTEDDVRRWAEKLQAVGHPIRLRIVMELLKGTKCVNDIRDLTAVRQPAVSQHLRVLRQSGLVDYRKRGTSRCYFLVSRSLVQKLIGLLQREQVA